MGSYTAGTTVDLTAVVTAEVDGQTVQISDTLTWTSDQGTVTAGPDSTDANGNVVMTATLINAPVGTANVTATTSNEIPATDPVVFTEAAPVPSAISVTDSAAPATAPTPSA